MPYGDPQGNMQATGGYGGSYNSGGGGFQNSGQQGQDVGGNQLGYGTSGPQSTAQFGSGVNASLGWTGGRPPGSVGATQAQINQALNPTVPPRVNPITGTPIVTPTGYPSTVLPGNNWAGWGNWSAGTMPAIGYSPYPSVGDPTTNPLGGGSGGPYGGTTGHPEPFGGGGYTGSINGGFGSNLGGGSFGNGNLGGGSFGNGNLGGPMNMMAPMGIAQGLPNTQFPLNPQGPGGFPSMGGPGGRPGPLPPPWQGPMPGRRPGEGARGISGLLGGPQVGRSLG